MGKSERYNIDMICCYCYQPVKLKRKYKPYRLFYPDACEVCLRKAARELEILQLQERYKRFGITDSWV